MPLKWVAAVAAAAILVVASVLTFRHSEPAEVQPVPHATTPTQEARNLESWLRRYSG